VARKASSHPTEVELEILRVLWDRGPSTVREVHNALRQHRRTGYSTTLKMIQVMTEKELLIKDGDRRPQIYEPAMSESEAQEGFVDDMIQRVFGGAADRMILRAIKSRHVSADDLAEIKRLIERLEGEGQ